MRETGHRFSGETRGLFAFALLMGLMLAAGLLTACSVPAQEQSATDTQTLEANDQSTNSDAGATSLQSRVAQQIDAMSLEQKVNQLFFVTPEQLTGVDVVVQAGDATRAALETHPVGGIAYFAQNLEDPDQTREMLTNTQTMAQEVNGMPLFLSVDEEGGTVTRIASNEAFGIQDVGDMAAIGATGDAEQARQAAVTIGAYLKDYGFNVDFAPVADVASNPDGEMTQRSFGADPQLVASMVTAAVRGFESVDMLCTAKHFPGIGGVVGDSHTGAITSDKTLDEIRNSDMLPFKAAIDAGVPFVMVGHLSTPAVTGDATPATLSRVWMTDVLRDELGFQGIIITDSLSMDAATEAETESGAPAASCIGVEALNAGADMILMPADFESCYQGVLDAVNAGEISEDRIDQSLSRILTVKLRDLTS